MIDCRYSPRKAMMLFTLLVATIVWGGSVQAQSSGPDELKMVDSKSALEKQIATILQERFQITPNLQSVNGDPEDLIAVVLIGPNEAQNTPALNVHINTRVSSHRNDADKTPIVQVISIASTADVTLNADKELEILRILNAINAQAIPAHVYAVNRRIVVVQNLALQEDAPISVAQFSASFVNVLRTWPTLLDAIRKQDLLSTE